MGSSRGSRAGIGILITWFSLSVMTSIVAPVMLTAFMKARPQGLGLSTSAAGLLLTVEMMAIGSVGLVARWFDRVSTRVLIRAGLAMAVIANLLTVSSALLAPLLAWRTLAGIGTGGAVIACSRGTAASEQPDRLASVLVVGSALFTSVVLIGLSALNGPSLPVVLACLAFLFGIGLILGVVPAAPIHADVDPTAAVTNTPYPRVAGALLITAMLLLNLADSGMYTLSGVLAGGAGLNERQLGYALAISTISGIAAAGAAGLLVNLRSRSLGIWGGMVLKAFAALGLVHARGLIPFTTLMVLFTMSLFFVIPLIIGTAAHLDRFGRLTAQVTGSIQIGSALGPVVAGFIADASGVIAMSTVTAAMLVASALFSRQPLRSVARIGGSAT